MIRKNMDIRVDILIHDELKTVWIRNEKYININELTMEHDDDNWKITITPQEYHRIENKHK